MYEMQSPVSDMPEHDWEEDRTRPLTEEGKKDSAIVLEFLKDKKIGAFYRTKGSTMGSYNNIFIRIIW